MPIARSYCLLKAWVCVAVLLAAAGGCDRHSAASGGKPVIVASIFPVANLVEQLTGDWADVVSLLPASESPHHAELTPDQLRRLAHADFVVVVGMGLDPWAEKGVEALGAEQLRVVRFADLIGSGESAKSSAPGDGGHPPAASNNHLWLDPVLTSKFVQAFSEQLKQRYPDHAAAIASAAERLLGDLHRLDREYAEQLAAVPERRLITFHNAFDLIAERYGLEIVVRLTDIELSPGGEVTPERIREALEAIKKYKLKVLYAEPEFPDQVIARLHEETKADVLQLDPQGNPAVEGYRTYQEMMRSNLRTLVKGQGGKWRVANDK
jgi:zinc transport system substrate-binding protein